MNPLPMAAEDVLRVMRAAGVRLRLGLESAPVADELNAAQAAVAALVAERDALRGELKLARTARPISAVELIVGERGDAVLTFSATVAEVRKAQASESALADALGLLGECDAVAKRRGDKYGLCDAIDNDGNPYQSAYFSELLVNQGEVK